MKKILTVLCLLACVVTNAQTDSVKVSDTGIRSNFQKNNGRVFLSRDQGDTWQRVDSGFPENESINAWATSGTRIIAATDEHGVYISEDGLKSWHPMNNGLPENLRILALISHQNLLVAGSYLQGVYVSSNEGDSWEPMNRGLKGMSIRSLYSAGNRLMAGTDEGIYISQDDGSWSKQMNGVQVNAFAFVNNTLYAATNLGALQSHDLGRTWSWAWQDTGAVFDFAVNGSKLVSFTSNKRVYETTSAGTYWVNLGKNHFTPPSTFRITTSSGEQLIYPWKNVFKSLRNNTPFRSDGLPAETSFMKILATPYGILVGVGFNGNGC